MIKEKHTILVVDDNEINRKYLQSVLDHENLNPIICDSGLGALDFLEKETPHLLLVDIQMPKMDGFELLRSIEKAYGHFCPFLAITAFPGNHQKQEIIDFGFDDFIQKPVKPNVLLDTVFYWLTSSGESFTESNDENEKVLNDEIIRELIKYTDENTLLELMEEFMRELAEDRKALSFLMGKDNHSEILSILHNLKGNAGSLGFTKLSSIALNTENRLREGRIEEAKIDLNHLFEHIAFLSKNYIRLLNIN